LRSSTDGAAHDPDGACTPAGLPRKDETPDCRGFDRRDDNRSGIERFGQELAENPAPLLTGGGRETSRVSHEGVKPREFGNDMARGNSTGRESAIASQHLQQLAKTRLDIMDASTYRIRQSQ
jgi:hypothetical protein